MRPLRIFVLVLLAGMQGCSSAGATTPAPASLHAPSAAPSPTAAATDVASDGPGDATTLKMVGLARQQAATTLGVPMEQLTVASVEPVQWRDASLGCPKPGVDYLPMPTPGYRITVKVGEVTYEYHADRESRVIQCTTSQP